MKDFIKFTFASCLGAILATAVFAVFASLLVGVIISSSAAGAENKKPIKSNSVLRVSLPLPPPELTNNTSRGEFDLNQLDIVGLQDIADLIEHAGTDDKIRAILVEGDQINTGLSSTRILREAIESFQSNGKPVISHAHHYRQVPYFLASVADEIYLSPTGSMDFRGFGSILPFFKGSLDRLGIGVDVFYAGDYKSATEPLRRTDMSEENREQTRQYLNDSYALFLEEIAASRQTTTANLRSAANDLATIQPEAAQSSGLIDRIGYLAEALEDLKENLGIEEEEKLHLISLNEYYLTNKHQLHTGDADHRIAVLYAEGEINDGKPGPGVISGDHYVSQLRKLRKNDDVKAIVLRINSPGGSVIASDAIWQEVENIQAEGKPVVASMGDVAASGGYYIACGADKIYSEPNTITGSIGVFSVLFHARQFLEEKIGMNFDTVSTGKYSTRLNSIYPPDEKEAMALQKIVDDYYQLFLQRVALGRRMDKESVHQVAQGRIWTGERARDLGLVDEIGDLDDAIQEAAELAGLEDYRIHSYPKTKNPLEQFMGQFMQQEESARSAIDGELSTWIPNYEFFISFVREKGPQARLPIIINH